MTLTLDCVLSSRSYAADKFSSEVGLRVAPLFGVPFVILGTVLSSRKLEEADLHKPLRRIFSKKSNTYYYLLEDEQ